jgi:hypothetical protein
MAPRVCGSHHEFAHNNDVLMGQIPLRFIGYSKRNPAQNPRQKSRSQAAWYFRRKRAISRPKTVMTRRRRVRMMKS